MDTNIDQEVIAKNVELYFKRLTLPSKEFDPLIRSMPTDAAAGFYRVTTEYIWQKGTLFKSFEGPYDQAPKSSDNAYDLYVLISDGQGNWSYTYCDLFDVIDKYGIKTPISFKEYIKAEQSIGIELKKHGFSVEHWWSGDADSFGPLVRCARILDEATGLKFVATYG